MENLILSKTKKQMQQMVHGKSYKDVVNVVKMARKQTKNQQKQGMGSKTIREESQRKIPVMKHRREQ